MCGEGLGTGRNRAITDGTTTNGTHAPAVNFEMATMRSTMNVAVAPTPELAAR